MTDVGLLLNLAAAAELFHDTDGVAFADLRIAGHRETWPLRSTRFRAWLRQRYYEYTRDAPAAAAINSAVNVLEAPAQFDGPHRTMSVRVAEHEGNIYLGLADESWRCVEISSGGWRTIADAPVRFRRAPGILPLPLPARGGAITQLQDFVNLAKPNDFMLVVGWLIGTLRRRRTIPSPGDIRRTGVGENGPL